MGVGCWPHSQQLQLRPQPHVCGEWTEWMSLAAQGVRAAACGAMSRAYRHLFNTKIVGFCGSGRKKRDSSSAEREQLGGKRQRGAAKKTIRKRNQKQEDTQRAPTMDAPHTERATKIW